MNFPLVDPLARLGSCGWELANASDGGFWDSVTGAANSASVAHSRSGGRHWRVNPTAVAEANFLLKRNAVTTNTNDVYVRLSLSVEQNPSAQATLVLLEDFTLAQTVGAIRINIDRTLELWNDAAQIGSDSAAMELNADIHNIIELTYIFGTGIITGFLNGVQFASGSITAGVDNASRIQLGFQEIITCELHFDDFAYNDQTGSAQTGRPNYNGRIAQYGRPNAAGDNAQGSRGGTDTGNDYSQLNETPPDDATTYYILDVNGDIIDLNTDIENLVFQGAKIVLCQVGMRHRAAGASQMTYRLRIKSQASGTVQFGTSTNHDDVTWKTNGDVVPRNYTLTSYTDPQTGGPWTVPRLIPAQIGVIADDAAPDVEITALWLLVEYELNILDPIISPGLISFPR